MAGDREELESLRRLADLEARANIPQSAPKEGPQPYGLPKIEGGWELGNLANKAGGAVTDLAAKVLPAERTNPLQYAIPTAPEAGALANMGVNAIPNIVG